MAKRKALIAAGILVSALVVPSWADDNASFRIMSYNIRHGTPSDNEHIDIAATAAAIAAESPDFVCLQEVDKNHGRSGNVDQAAYLAEAAGLGYSTFCKTIDFSDGGKYGIAILSKTKPLSVTMTELPRIDATYEQRMLLVCEFEDFYVANSHFDLNASPRVESVTTISNVFSGLAKPVFFTGDWNDTPSSETLSKIKGFMTVLSPESGAASFSDRIIDYITMDSASAGEYVVRTSYVKQVPDVSDHNPVIAEIVRRPADSSVWYDGNGVVAFGIGAVSVAYRSETETNAWLDITVAAGVEATLTALAPDPSVTLSIRKLGPGSLALTNSCGGFADLQVAAGSALLASAADVPGTTYLAGGELVAVTNFTAGAIVLTADSSIRVAPGMTMQTGKIDSYAALKVAGHTLSKFGDGKLTVSGTLNGTGESGSTYVVEEGTVQLPGDCWGGHSSNGSGYTLVVHENGTVMATTHVPLPNVVMRGGRFDGYVTSPFDGTNKEQDLRTYKSWAMKHLIKVLASTNGSPSVISSYASHIGHASYMPTFDIDEGAELQLDVMICNGEAGGGVSKDSGFTKIGPGTLTFLRGGSITGASALKEGTLKFAAGASLGPSATLNTYAGTTIELEDGAAFDTPVNSSQACSAEEYAALTNCAIWVDAWQETAAEGASVPTIANRGTVVGSFKPPTSGSCTSPCTFTTNGVNGRPSYKFNGSNQSMQFSDLACGTLDDPKNELMIFLAFERNSYTQYRGFLSFALASNTQNDNNASGTIYQEDDGPTNFGFFNKNASGTRIDNIVKPTSATNGAPSVLSFYSGNSSRSTRLDYLDGTYNRNSNSGAFEFAFDRMALGARSDKNAKPRYPWDGTIGELIVCTNYNSATYNTLLAYMKRKWQSGRKGEKCGIAVIKVPQGTAAAASIGGLSDGRTPTLTKTGAGELMVGSVASDGDVVVAEGALSLIPTSVVSKIDVWMDAADEGTLTVANGEVVSVRNKGRAGGSFVRNTRAGVSSTVSPDLPLLASMNGHPALGFDGTRALVLDSYTNHNDDATYTVFLAARVGDGVDLTVNGSGLETSPYSLATAASGDFDYAAPVGCHFEPKSDGRVLFYSDVKGRSFGATFADFKAGNEFIYAHYNSNYGALGYIQTFTNGVVAGSVTKSSDNAFSPHPAAIDVVQVGGRLGPRGTSYYYGSASSGRMWKGQVGELIVCTRQPTAAERAAILAYLRAKWCVPGPVPATPSAIETVLAPSLDRNVEMTVSGGTELKSLAAAQPLSGLVVTGNATLTRGGAVAASSAMFDVAGDVLLPADMMLRIVPGLEGNADLINCSGTLNGSGTTWTIDAECPSRWKVKTTQDAIRARYSLPGMTLIFK